MPRGADGHRRERPKVRFAPDSLLEEAGFELSVPGHDEFCWGALPREGAEVGSARFLLLGEPFHGTLRIYGFGGLRFAALLVCFCEALKRAVREQQNLFNASVVLIEDKASGTQLILLRVRQGLDRRPQLIDQRIAVTDLRLLLDSRLPVVIRPS